MTVDQIELHLLKKLAVIATERAHRAACVLRDLGATDAEVTAAMERMAGEVAAATAKVRPFVLAATKGAR